MDGSYPSEGAEAVAVLVDHAGQAPDLAFGSRQALAQLVVCEMHPLNNLRVRSYLRDELKLDDAALSRWYEHWIAEGFASLEALVRRFSGGRYCFGDAVSVADVCFVPQVYNARRFNCDLAPYPTILRIADGLRGDPAFARAAPDGQPDAK